MIAHIKLARVRVRNEVAYGAIVDRGFINLSARYPRFRSLDDVVVAGKLHALAQAADGLPVDFSVGEIAYETPLATPQKIICVGVNYPNRNEEYKDGQEAPANPSLFVRFPNSFVGHDRALVRPKASKQLDYEGEVVIVIGKGGRHIQERDALNHVVALSLCNEGTIRDWVRHAKFNVTQGKNFDGSGSMGPWLVPFVGEGQLADIRLTTRVNGEMRQDDRTSRMIFGFRKLIAYISSFTTLAPGDIIVTGTPTGAGARFDPPKWLVPGDIVEVEAEGIGLLRNSIKDETL